MEVVSGTRTLSFDLVDSILYNASSLLFMEELRLKSKRLGRGGDWKTYHEKMREATASCLLADALSKSSLVQMHTQPPSKLPMTWARPRRTAAANPSLKA